MTINVAWLIAATALIMLWQWLLASWVHESSPSETLYRLSRAADRLAVLLQDKETIRYLERITGRFALLERSSGFSGSFLTAIGVALGLLGSAFADWVLHGSGFIWQAWSGGASLGVLARAAEVAGLGIILSVVTGFVLLPIVDAKIRNQFRLRRLAEEVDAMNALLDRALKIVDKQIGEPGPRTTPA